MPYYHIILGKKHMDLLYAKDEEEAILIIEKNSEFLLNITQSRNTRR